MENHKIKYLSKNLRFKNKNKVNKIYLKKKDQKIEDYLRNDSPRIILPNLIHEEINDHTSKVTITEGDKRNESNELNNKNKFFTFRGNYSISITSPKDINIKKYNISPTKNKHKENLFHEIKSICDELYESKNEDNNSRMKLRENIMNSVDNYIFNNLSKHIYCPEIKDKKKKKKEIISRTIKKEKRNNFIDYNKLSLKEIMNNYYDEPLKEINFKNTKIITYGNYAKKNIIYNHPKLYTLNNEFYKGKKLSPIKANTFLEFSKLIPIKVNDQNDYNKKIYSVYKTMRNKKQATFHV